MKYKKKQELKRKIAAIIAIMIAFIMVLGLILPVFAAAPTQTTAINVDHTEDSAVMKENLEKEVGSENFDTDISVGFDGMYLVGHSVHIRGSIVNKGTAFRGELQVKSYLYQDSYADYKEYVLYSHKMELTEGAREMVDMEVPMGTVVKHLEVSLVTESGEVVFRKNVAVKALSPDVSAIAVLSSQPQQVRYLSQLEETMGVYQTKVIFLDEKTFPVSKEVMRNFTAVILDDIDTSDLQQAQKNALGEWVRSGGLLILGTGTHSSRVLGGLDFLGDLSIGESRTISSLETINGESIGLSAPMTVTEIRRDKAEPIWKVGETVLTDRIQVGAGDVFLHHFALGLAPFGNLPQAGSVLGAFYEENGQEHWKTDPNDMGDIGGRPVANFFTRVPSANSGSIYLIFAIVVVYIIFVGPVLYYVLKKKDKQSKGWLLIPLSALICMGIIFLLSFKSIYHNSIVQIASITEIKQGADSGNTHIGLHMMSPKKGDMVFSAEGMKGFYVADPNHNWSSTPTENKKERCIYKIDTGESAEVTFYDNGIWKGNMLQTDAVVQLGGTVDSDVHFDGNVCTGTVTNHTTINFSDAYIEVNGMYIPLGALPAGESVTVKESCNPAKLVDAYESVRKAVWKGEESPRSLVRKHKITKQKAFYLHRQEDMILSNRDEGFGNEKMQKGGRRQRSARFYGFNEAPLYPQEKYINGKPVKEMNINMYFVDFWEDLAYQKAFTTPFVFGAEAVTEQTHYHADYASITQGYCGLDNLTEQNQTVEAVYAVDEALRVDNFSLSDMDSEAFSEIQAQIYNRSTNKWEDLQKIVYQAATYMNENNEIRVRVVIKPHESISMPIMRIKGGGKYA